MTSVDRLEAETYIPFPLPVAVQVVKVREEKERVEVESAFPPSIYTAPPLDVAEQEVNVMEERVSLCPEVRMAEIAPPFSDEHDLNAALEIVRSAGMDVNSNTAPFPDCLLIESKMLLPVSVIHPGLTDMSG